ATEIAEVVSDIRQKLPDLESPPQLEPEQARFRLYDSITTFLQNIAQAQPILLVLEDLHWADRSSLLLLEFVVQSIQAAPILILGTYRDLEVARRHPLYQTLGSLIREQQFVRIHLHGLSQTEVSQLLHITTGTDPSSQLVELIHERTEGNPLFVHEISRVLDQQLDRSGQHRFVAIPEGVKEAISRRLDRVSEGCNQLLTLASVIGREFDFQLLRALSGQFTEEQVQELLDEGLEAHVIEEIPGPVERYQFSHALVQETLSEELSTHRKVRLHAQIGEVLEIIYGAEAPVHAAELSHHFGEAATVLGSEKLVHYALLAGERALDSYAHEQALVHFERALAVKEGQPLDSETAALLFGQGRALAATDRNRAQESIDALNCAFDYYADSGDVTHAVAVAETRVPPFMLQLTVKSQIVRKALALVDPKSIQAGRLLSQSCWELGRVEGDFQGAEDAFKQALEIAQREGDLALELRTLAAGAHVDSHHLRWGGTLEKASSVARLSNWTNDYFAEANAYHWAANASMALGNLEEARKLAIAQLEPARKLRDGNWLGSALASNEMVAQLQGNWQTAREFGDQGLSMGNAAHPILFKNRAQLESQMGNLELAQTYLDRLPDDLWRVMTVPQISYIANWTDPLDEVTEAGKTILTSSEYPSPFLDLANRAGLAFSAVVRGDKQSAQEQYDALEPLTSMLIPALLITTDRLLALLAHTTGNLETASQHFEDALAFCRRAEYRPELAWCLYEYSNTLSQRSGPGDPEKATALAQESLSIAEELSMIALLNRLGVFPEEATSPGVITGFPDGLTAREMEVLLLIARGCSNQEIAGELVLSVRTVERHVTNIYRKISAKGRADAANYVMRHQLD
ncbi:MAG: helix-turn-helix transcriptional regulator, partial [Dehalococcoidia bacterium]